MRQQGEQVVEPALADEVIPDPQCHREFAVERGVDTGEEVPGAVHEDLPVLGAGRRQRRRAVRQVIGEDGAVVELLACRCRRVEETADAVDGGEAVPEVLDVGAANGRTAAAPFAFALVQDVDGLGEDMRADRDRAVLVADVFGEGERVPVPEGATEHLVRRRTVRPRRGSGADGREGGRELRARAVQQGHQLLVPARREGVVTVEEGQVRGAGIRLPGSGVARVTEAPGLRTGGPDQAEAPVSLGEPPRDLRGAVRGTVVDHHHVEGVQRLLRDRPEAILQIPLDVVDGDDDGQSGRHTVARAFRAGLGAGDGLFEPVPSRRRSCATRRGCLLHTA
ncbi:hypothetical protein M2266_002740 [Streptomyces sp. SPB162]|nr:hypothetical protein [Streptomyces sp. SPB162]